MPAMRAGPLWSSLLTVRRAKLVSIKCLALPNSQQHPKRKVKEAFPGNGPAYLVESVTVSSLLLWMLLYIEPEKRNFSAKACVPVSSNQAELMFLSNKIILINC